MKELSIEEKAKAYDEAIKRVEDIVGGKCPKPFVFTEGLFDYIFPELKESEDEKIRACIEMCLTDIDEQRFADFNTNLKECRDWLEKQSEQKPKGKTTLEAINEEKVDNANKVEPQDELTEFEKAVKQVMEEAIECGDTHNLKADADMLLSLIQKPDEEYNITGIHSKHAEGKLGEMIKNLKPVWSEEDETNLRRTEYAVMKFFGGDCSLVGWLRKSLKERYTWKLSDEQMEALEHFVRSIGESGYASPYDNNTKLLYSLLSDLKKLKE